METDMLADIFGLPPEAAWQEHAACAGTDPDVFANETDELAARLICRRCPVQALCLDYALDNDERFGIWGGMNRRERDRLRRSTTAK